MAQIFAQVSRPINEEPDEYITELVNNFLTEHGNKAWHGLKFSKKPFADNEGIQNFLLTAEVSNDS